MKLFHHIIICVFAGIFMAQPVMPQTEEDLFVTISGVVRDRLSKQVLPYANISVIGQETATVTNSDGEFILKIPRATTEQTILIAHMGYYSSRIKIKKASDKLVCWLTPSSKVLKEVIVKGKEPRTLVRQAIEKIPLNYDAQDRMLTGFYRETAKKRRHFINLSEAVVNVFKSNYKTNDLSRDKASIEIGRKLVSTKASDTLAVKLVGGPTIGIFLDAVKNPDILLTLEEMEYYEFHMEEVSTINERPQYVVSFYPRKVLPYALYIGKMYIDQERLSFTRLEIELDLSDKAKAIQAVLKKKPFGLRFRPQEVSILVDYTEHNGVSYLSYIRDVIRFKCDWNKKLFHTNYTVVAEMVITDRKSGQPTDIPRKARFSENAILSDNVSMFYDEDFWGPYNIIQPEEALDKAINRMKKQHKAE